ncbi:hypothetical protein [Chitinophaga tropicalis]|uniref:Uncharacterized protein n=1 Tax=Chitinophaga tropicalis TaxID=2683588 RepID=A0A7K1U5S1_9BACT|nr:hypothetical protein [Chitinophaga tropicalis]MVT09690.1 hypothetical protein [Chitinophaga tropicalis]
MSKNPAFILKGINTEEFALIEEAYNQFEQSGCQFSIKFGSLPNKRIIAVIVRFTFDQKKTPFLILELGCQFEVESQSWEDISARNNVVLPVDFARHLASISLGVARGVLHAKTESSVLNQFMVPAIDLQSIIKEELTIIP